MLLRELGLRARGRAARRGPRRATVGRAMATRRGHAEAVPGHILDTPEAARQGPRQGRALAARCGSRAGPRRALAVGQGPRLGLHGEGLHGKWIVGEGIDKGRRERGELTKGSTDGSNRSPGSILGQGERWKRGRGMLMCGKRE
jgi:hypothetical protein